jgi:putative chitinase
MSGVARQTQLERRVRNGVDLLFGSKIGRTVSDGTAGNALPAPALAVQAAQDEIEAILAVVPRTYRANATWAVPLLLNCARAGGVTHSRRIAYLLATAQHAAHFGARLEERGAGPAADGADRSFDRYEPGTPQGTALGNTQAGDGARFRGRGFVSIKGRASYATWSQRLAMPEEIVEGNPVPYFVAHPEAMAQPSIAAQTLVRGMRDGLFTGIPLGLHVNDKKTDFHSARRVVGGLEHARDVAAIATTFARAIEDLQSDRHREHMARLANARALSDAGRDLLKEIGDAVARLAARGEIMPLPQEVVEWNGEARQGKFVQLDERTCALHQGRGTYIRLDVQRDLNGIVPPEARNMALKRSGEVRVAARHAEVNFWR